MIEFDISFVQVLALLVGTVSPVLIDLVTKAVTSNKTKAVLLLTISTVTGLGAELLEALRESVTYDLGAGLLGAAGVFIWGLAFHLGISVPTGLSAKAEVSGNKGGAQLPAA